MKHIESDLQIACFKLICNGFPKLKKYFRGSANGEYRPKKKYFKKNGQIGYYCPAGKKLSEMGVQRGDPDVMFLKSTAEYSYLAIEFKKKGEYQSPEQKEFEQMVEEENRGKYVVCHSIDEFLHVLTNYLHPKQK